MEKHLILLRKAVPKSGKGRVLLVFLCLIGLITWYIMPRTVDLALPGVVWRDGDTSLCQTVTVQIQGKLTGYHFWGSISVPELELTAEDESFSLPVFGNYVRCFQNSNLNDEQCALGAIVAGRSMRKFALIFHEDCTVDFLGNTSHLTIYIGGRGELMLSAPAETREDALTLANQLCAHSTGEFPDTPVFTPFT